MTQATTRLKHRLIERAMPLREVSAQSAREKSIRHGHISTLHIWWARRPLAACRAAIYAALLDDPGTDAEREKLLKEVAALSNWDIVNGKDYSGLLDKARTRIMQNRTEPPRVLDPFTGGGAIPLEALRLGCEAYANELNPVAYIIERCTLVYPQKYGKPGEVPDPRHGTIEVKNKLAEDVKRWGKWVLEEARKDIGKFYPPGTDGATPVAYLWARTVTCPNPSCRAEVPLVRQTWLAKERGIALLVEPNREQKKVNFVVTTLDKNSKLDDDLSEDGTGGEGTSRGGSFTCPICGQGTDVAYVRIEGKANRIGHRAMAVVENRKGEVKSYRAATEADQALLERAKERVVNFPNIGNLKAIPNESLPAHGTLGFRVQNYGILEWGQLFNSRQGIALATFASKVRQAYTLILEETKSEDYAKAIVTYLAILVDRLADYDSVICRWVAKGEFIGNTFTRQAIPMVWDYCEVNPFSGATGSFEGAMEWVNRVLETNSDIGLPSQQRLGSATRLPFEDNYFDAVITDPPYYDAVPYADLSDFFYVWMRRTIGYLYPEVFRTPLTPKAAEIVQHAARFEGSQELSKKFFEDELGKSFAEAARVVKDDGIVTIVFAHKSTDAWETLINSLLAAGLYVTASWPLNTEMGARMRAHDSAALASSIFIVCRKRTAIGDGYYDQVLPEMRENIRRRLGEFWEQGISGPDFFISAIGPALEAFGRYGRVLLPTGEEVPASQFLEDVRGVVADYTLERILERSRSGVIDAESRFYLFWRWSFGAAETPIDEARKLAQALGAHVGELFNKSGGLLRQKGDKAKIRGVQDRKDSEGLGTRGFAGAAPGLIDILHRACLEWESGGTPAAAEFLAQADKAENDEFWAYAQALGEILPQGDREKQMIQGLLAIKGAVQKGAVAYQERHRPRPKAGEGQLIMLGFEDDDGSNN